MATQQELPPKNDIHTVPLKSTWREAWNSKAMMISYPIPSLNRPTLGYHILWYLWSADIWFGRFPLLKFIVGVNILLWIVTIWINV